MEPLRLAAIDIGTNTIKLLVAAVEHGALTALHEDSRTTRLGEGVAKTKRLTGEALERTAEEVGRRVRQTMQEISGSQPEELPPAEDIRVVRKKLKSAQREFRKMDRAKPAKQFIKGTGDSNRL